MDALDPLQFSREEVRRLLREFREERLPAQSVTIHELDEAQLVAWRAATAGTHERLLERIGGRAREIYARVQEGKRAFAARERNNANGRDTATEN